MGEDDLDCDRGMGNYWEPIDQESTLESSSTASYGYVAPPEDRGSAARVEGEVAPVHLQGQFETSEHPERRGGYVSQYGGPGRPTGSDEYGNTGGSGDSGDDDRYTSPFNEQGGDDQYGADRPFGYQAEERYWTDYLRIAAPVVGVILMLGLVWFWVANMLSDDNDTVATDDQDTVGSVIDAETPEATEEDDEEGDEPITVATPDPEENDAEEAENGDEDVPTTLGPGATAIVVGTGEAGLNIRSSASTEGEVLDSVPDGTELTITGESEEAEGFTWWPVESGETTGFVVEEFIEVSQ